VFDMTGAAFGTESLADKSRERLDVADWPWEDGRLALRGLVTDSGIDEGSPKSPSCLRLMTATSPERIM